MSRMREYIKDLPSTECDTESVTVMANARELIMRLPSPDNAVRDETLIPDIPVKLILSTTPRLPEKIRTLVAESEDRVIFGDNELAGLCLNGRGMPPEIFLHDQMMTSIDATGALFEEVAWHELVHGIEGIVPDGAGGWTRETPWSYDLQKRMKEIDASCGHKSFLDKVKEEKARVLFRYLREGTELQQNVSEIFARASSYYMLSIAKNGHALQPDDPVAFRWPEESEEKSRGKDNLRELFYGLSTYSNNAQNVFFRSMPEMVERISTLYGCKPL